MAVDDPKREQKNEPDCGFEDSQDGEKNRIGKAHDELRCQEQEPPTPTVSSTSNQIVDIQEEDILIGIQPLPATSSNRRQVPSAPGAYATTGPLPFGTAGSSSSRRMQSQRNDASRFGNHDSRTMDVEVGNVPVAEPVDDSVRPERPRAEEVDPDRAALRTKALHLPQNRRYMCFLALFIIAIAAFLGLVFGVLVKPSDSKSGESTDPPATLAPTSMESYVLSLLSEDTIANIERGNTPQAQAFQWLLASQNHVYVSLGDYPGWRLQQRFAMATLYYATNGDHWTGGEGWLNHSTHECTWQMSSLPDRLASLPPEAVAQMVMHFNLVWWTIAGQSVCEDFDYAPNNDTAIQNTGSSSTSLTATEAQVNRGAIRQLRLMRNNMEGKLPEEIYYLLPHLKALTLFGNQVTGTISPSIASLSQLQVIDLVGNQMGGSLPSELGLLTQLVTLGLHSNGKLGGILPTELGSLQMLQAFVAEENSFVGTLPSQLGSLRNLYRLYLNQNRITGSIPRELAQMGALRELDLADNELTSTIPDELGFFSLEVKYLNVSGNAMLEGTVPEGLCGVEGVSWECTTHRLCGCNCTCSGAG